MDPECKESLLLRVRGSEVAYYVLDVLAVVFLFWMAATIASMLKGSGASC